MQTLHGTPKFYQIYLTSMLTHSALALEFKIRVKSICYAIIAFQTLMLQRTQMQNLSNIYELRFMLNQ